MKKIDIPVRELVITLNELPFVDTVSCCSSHLSRKQHSKRTIQITDHIFFSEGWISFQTDYRYAAVPDFMGTLEREAAAYPFVTLEEHETGYDDMLDGKRRVNKYLEDFGRYASHYFSVIGTSDGLFFSDVEKARTRRQEIYGFWTHLAGVCREFQKRNDLAVMLP